MKTTLVSVARGGALLATKGTKVAVEATVVCHAKP